MIQVCRIDVLGPENYTPHVILYVDETAFKQSYKKLIWLFIVNEAAADGNGANRNRTDTLDVNNKFGFVFLKLYFKN